VKRSPLRRRSVKTAARDRRYTVERREFLQWHPMCELLWDRDCTHTATEIHHMAGRAASVFFRTDLWRAACHSCHQAVTNHPAEAIDRGLSVRRNQVAS
jgi:hypothetical protein